MALWDLYAGATRAPATSRRVGTVAGMATSGQFGARRRRLLVRGLAPGGGLQKSKLHAGDLALLGLTGPKASTKNTGKGWDMKGSILGKVGGLFSNLGSDVYDFAKGFGPGLITAGKAIGADIVPGGESQVLEKILKPTWESYKQTYGQGNVLKNIYEHPLGPALDALAVVSGGASLAGKLGQTAAKTGAPGASLARMTSRTGRPDAVLTAGKAQVNIPRMYTPRPIAKASQIGLDKLGARYPAVGQFQAVRAGRREAKESDQLVKQMSARNVMNTVAPLTAAFKAMTDPDEQLAFALSKRGINTPELVQKYSDDVKQVLEDPAQVRELENRGISLDLVRQRADVNERVLQKITEPSEQMKRASLAWDRDVARGRKQLGIEDPQHAAGVSLYQRRLTEEPRVEGAKAPEGDVAPDEFEVQQPAGTLPVNYVPDIAAEGFAPRNTRLSKLTGRSGAMVKAGNQSFNPRVITGQNILASSPKRYMHDVSGETVFQGLMRTDPRVYVEHAAKRERDLVEGAFAKQLAHKNAAKGEDGEPLTFLTNDDMRRTLGEGWTLIHPDFAIAWYRQETNLTEAMEKVMTALEREGADPDAAQQIIDGLSDAQAKAFVSSHWGAMKRKGIAVTDEFFNYQKRMAEVTNPFNWKAMRGYARFLHYWRNMVLAYMPRWAFNTAVGSFVTNMAKGVMNPMDYVRGSRMGRSYIEESGNVVQRPTAGSRGLNKLTRGVVGRADLDIEGQRLERLEPPGVALGQVSLQEHYEGSYGSYKNDLGIRFPTARLVQGVQSIEDFFRRASFQHSLRRERRFQKTDEAVAAGRPLKIEEPEVEARDVALGAVELPQVRQTAGGVRVSPEQEAVFNVEGYTNYRRALEAFSKDPPAGSVIWRGEARRGDPDTASAEGIGMHWTLTPDAIVSPRLDDMEGGQNIIWEAVLDDPENQSIPRSHGIWSGQSRSLGFEAEVRLRPKTQVRVVGAWVHRGDTDPNKFHYALNHEKMRENGWEFVPISKTVPIGRPLGKDAEAGIGIEYDRYKDIEATEAPNLEVENPDVPMQEMSDVLKDHDADVLKHNGKVTEMMGDEDLVRRTLRDVNKFGYNYAALGPIERKYVRQFVPFWGWYKFISLLAHRLPVEYPGRTVAMNAIAQVGNDALEELGDVPPWVKGALILGADEKSGKIRYLSTLGMNPFGSFFNPFSPEGPIEGILAPGQLSPGLQAIAQAAGYDPMTGGEVRVSAESGAVRDFFGSLINKEGEQIPAAQVQAPTRGVMALLRSIPQYRMGEKFLEGGASVYPEHVPFIQPRRMKPESEDAAMTGVGALGLGYIGLAPKGYDLGKYQQMKRKRERYYTTRQRNAIRKTAAKFEAAR